MRPDCLTVMMSASDSKSQGEGVDVLRGMEDAKIMIAIPILTAGSA